MHDEDTPHARLKAARSRRFADAAAAAEALGIPEPTYHGHENGSRGYARSAHRYAAFFRVSIDWLLTGKGPMGSANTTIPLVGLVGAGSAVYPVTEDTAGLTILDEIDIPDKEYCAALLVRGDSQYPRFLDGEIVVYDTRPIPTGRLVNKYAIVELEDGRRLLKLLRRGSSRTFNLESHNAPPEDDVDIVAAYKLVMLLPR